MVRLSLTDGAVLLDDTEELVKSSTLVYFSVFIGDLFSLSTDVFSRSCIL